MLLGLIFRLLTCMHSYLALGVHDEQVWHWLGSHASYHSGLDSNP